LRRFCCLNPTSNKSRIETSGWTVTRSAPRCLNPTSNKSRIETQSGQYRAAGALSGLNPTSNKSRIETRLCHRRVLVHSFGLNPTSNKSRIETSHRRTRPVGVGVGSESDFQQIKDWNQLLCLSLKPNVFSCLNPTSNKSRIETKYRDVWKRNSNEGLNPTSNKSRIETSHSWDLFLKRLRSESDFQQIKDWNTMSLSWLYTMSTSESDFQQIKDWNRDLGFQGEVEGVVWIRLPTNQGLKLFCPG